MSRAVTTMTADDTVVEALSVALSEAEILRDVSLRIAPGTTLGLVGESGSGKSTLGSALLGLLPPGFRASGSIVLGGDEIVGMSEADLAVVRGSRAAMVFQNPFRALNPSLRVGGQIAEALEIHRVAHGATAVERAVALLDEVGIDEPAAIARAYPHELSGGMLQRAVIALAISCGPELLVADEPTTALDARVQARILDLLGRLVSERRMAMLLISHDLGVVARLADEIAVIYSGTIVERCSATELFTQPCHPYTRALMSASPRVDGATPVRLPAIAGQAAPAGLPMPGCRFAPRCPLVIEHCRCDVPPLVLRSDGHGKAACWVTTPPKDPT